MLLLCFWVVWDSKYKWDVSGDENVSIAQLYCVAFVLHDTVDCHAVFPQNDERVAIPFCGDDGVSSRHCCALLNPCDVENAFAAPDDDPFAPNEPENALRVCVCADTAGRWMSFRAERVQCGVRC